MTKTHTNQINTIENDVKANDSRNFPRFFVYFSGVFERYRTYKPLKFNRVKFNIGRMYNTSSGKVRIPVNGYYQFTFHTLKWPSRGRVKVAMMINGVPFTTTET